MRQEQPGITPLTDRQASPKRLVVLTATVNPQNVPFLSRADPSDRFKDYLASIDYYSRRLDSGTNVLLLVENSGWPLDPLIRAASNACHDLNIISYVEQSEVQTQGKGRGEAGMFDRVADWLSSQKTGYASVTKLTGRLVIPNIRRMLEVGDPSRFFRCRISNDLSMVDTRIFTTDQQTWLDHLTNASDLVREHEGRFLEHAAALRLSEAIYAGVPWIPFAREPLFTGYSGTSGRRYGTLAERIKRHARNVLREVPRGAYR